MFGSFLGSQQDNYRLVLFYSVDNTDHESSCVVKSEFEWTNSEDTDSLLNRFLQIQSDAQLRATQHLLNLQFQEELQSENEVVRVKFTFQRKVPSLIAVGLTGSGTINSRTRQFLQKVFQGCDISLVQYVQSVECFGNFWSDFVSSVDVWSGLSILNLNNCGLSSLPAEVGLLGKLRELRLQSNKLGHIPKEIGKIQSLQVLLLDNNQITSLPAELKNCCNLLELSIENNKLQTPVLDLQHLRQLDILFLAGNPLEYVPDLNQCRQLRKFSLAGVRIVSDKALSQTEATVSQSSYVSKATSLTNFFQLIFSRSTCQHPLIATSLTKLFEDSSTRTIVIKQQGAVQQLILMLLSDDSVVVRSACLAMKCLAQDIEGANKLIKGAIMRALNAFLQVQDKNLLVDVLNLIGSLASGSDLISEQVIDENIIQQLADIICSKRTYLFLRISALSALASLSFPKNNKRLILQHGSLITQIECYVEKGIGILKQQAARCLAILGQNIALRKALGYDENFIRQKRGLRILSLDGGGMRGIAMVQMLRKLKEECGKNITDLFDVIGGTSTGAVLASALGIFDNDLDECEDIYRSLGRVVFSQPNNAEELSWSTSLYRMLQSSHQSVRLVVLGNKHSAAPFESLLQSLYNIKVRRGAPSDHLIDSAVLGGPHVFLMATQVNLTPAQAFAFRNYEFDPNQEAPCNGSSRHLSWQSIRASSAAPIMLEEFQCGEDRFQDGAELANNPTIFAIREAQQLYPNMPIDCVVSLGCGSWPAYARDKSVSGVLELGNVLVESACNTNRAHEAMEAILSTVQNGPKYFRFNPVDARCEMELDDLNPASTERLLHATREYISYNLQLFQQAAQVLTCDTHIYQQQTNQFQMQNQLQNLDVPIIFCKKVLLLISLPFDDQLFNCDKFSKQLTCETEIFKFGDKSVENYKSILFSKIQSSDSEIIVLCQIGGTDFGGIVQEWSVQYKTVICVKNGNNDIFQSNDELIQYVKKQFGVSPNEVKPFFQRNIVFYNYQFYQLISSQQVINKTDIVETLIFKVTKAQNWQGEIILRDFSSNGKDNGNNSDLILNGRVVILPFCDDKKIANGFIQLGASCVIFKQYSTEFIDKNFLKWQRIVNQIIQHGWKQVIDKTNESEMQILKREQKC